MPETIFKAEKLAKRYRKFDFRTLKRKNFHALSGLDLEIHRGDIYGFVGKSGAGKTTLIRIMAGLAAQTAGEVTLFGEKDSKNMYIQRSRINGIIEAPAFYPSLTALIQTCYAQSAAQKWRKT